MWTGRHGRRVADLRRRGRQRHLRCHRLGERRPGHDRLRRREPGRRPRASPTSRSARSSSPRPPRRAAAVVANSDPVEGRGDYDFAISVNRETTSADEYPIVLVSYHIGCVEYDDQAKADAVKAFESYVISEEGQQAAADAAGSSPISADAARPGADRGRRDHGGGLIRPARPGPGRPRGRPGPSCRVEAGAPHGQFDQTERSVTTTSAPPEPPRPKRRVGDRIFAGSATGAGILILLVLAGVAAFLLIEAWPAVTAPASEHPGRRGAQRLHRAPALRHDARRGHRPRWSPPRWPSRSPSTSPTTRPAGSPPAWGT